MEALKDDMKKALEQIGVLNENVGKMQSDIHKITQLVTGDNLVKDDKGFIGKVNKNEERISALEKFNIKFVAFMIGLSLASGIGIAGLLKSLLVK